MRTIHASSGFIRGIPVKGRAMSRITMFALLVGFLLLLAAADRTLFGIAAQAQAPQGQSQQAPSAPNIVRVPVPRADRAAPPSMTNHRCHIFPSKKDMAPRHEANR